MESVPKLDWWVVAMVREWVATELPGYPEAGDLAAAVARAALQRGTTPAGARRHAQAFAECWVRHPSHAREARRAVRLAS
ncbi:MAG TPA: hypothetical protein VMB82_07030 [Acidimicrobiales bacterium]|nr:hypothetical protein [Acidimicrobiales bacterium]